MPRKNYLFTDFMAGEVSPRMEMRDDLEGRRHGVGELENWIVTPQGTAITAIGSEYITDIMGMGGRVFSFPVSPFTNFIIVVTETTIYLASQEGLLVGGTLVQNGNFDQGDTYWTTDEDSSSAVLFLGGAVLIRGGVGASQEASIRQELTVVATETHELRIQVASGEGNLEVRIGETERGTEILNATYSTSADIVIEDLISSTTSMWIEMAVIGPGNPEKIINSVAVYNTEAALTPITFPSPWTSFSDITFIQTKMAPHEPAIYMVSGNIHPQVLTYDITTEAWSLGPVVFTSPPTEWVAGSYPGSITFFQGRMYLGGSTNNPNRLWASKSGQANFTDFTIGVLADDALDHDLSRRGKIQWLAGAQSLVAGTESSEFIINSEGGVIVPGDIKSTPQSSFGSTLVSSVEVGNDLLYVSPDGRKIRKMGYEWSRDAWRNYDITFASEHITGGGAYFTHLHYAPNPFGVIASVDGQANLIFMTYEAASGTGGFMRRTTQGSFLSICVSPFIGIDEVWALVDRSEGGGVLSLERFNSIQYVKLDSYTRFSSMTPISSVQVPHLAGKECQVLVDGAVHPNTTPSTPDGDVTLEFSGNVIQIGLGFTSTLTTLPVSDAINPMGTTRPMKKRWTQVFVRILNSYRPMINGVRPPDRLVPTPMGEGEDPRTESIFVTDEGWDLEAKITIEQDLPLPVEIGGIFGQLDNEQI